MMEQTQIRHYLGNIKRLITLPVYQKEILVSEATNIFGCSFGTDGWHHIRQTLKEYDNNIEIPFNETTLYKYLKNFCPRNILEASGINRASDNIRLFCYPWGMSFKISGESNKDVWQSRFCGPSSDSFINEEYHRIVNLYRKLKISGYKPWSMGNGFIGGTFLINRYGQRRFVILQGNHRMAILAHLGLKKLNVRSIPGFFSKVYETDVKEWPFVKNRIFDEREALEVFNMFFDQTGFHVKHIIENSFLKS
jgi:hypothetical protein